MRNFCCAQLLVYAHRSLHVCTCREYATKKTVLPLPAGPYQLPQLPYDYDALEPVIDRRTNELHHGKHHQTYVSNLNDAVDKAGGQMPELYNGMTLTEVVKAVGTGRLPESIEEKVRAPSIEI